jgi:hypothetical protein
VTAAELADVAVKAIQKVGLPASHVAADCPVVTVAEAVGLVRLALAGGVTFKGKDLHIDMSVMTGMD